jgi:hypothetical protein
MNAVTTNLAGIMQNVLKFAAAMALLIGLGLAHGRLTDRWGVPAAVKETAQLVNRVPAEVAGWTSRELEVSERTMLVAGAEGMLKREYRDPKSGKSVQVMVVCGRPGPISLHPPTVCFVGSGMQQREAEVRQTIDVDGNGHEFLVADFRPPGVLTEWARTYWGWSTDTALWHAPEDPRIEHAGRPYLYKLYFTTPIDLTAAEAEVETDPEALAFMQTFLRELPKYARPESGVGGTSPK